MRLADGWQPWVLTPTILALLALAATPYVSIAAWFGGGFLVLALAMAAFFRDPDREIGEGIVAAADGRLKALDDEAVTFLNLHNVHVVRAPYAGTITSVDRIEGSRRPAFLDGARHNAGIEITVDTDTGERTVRLLVGLLARRAVCYVEEGGQIDKGQRIGMIRLGSRVDVELPSDAETVVREGQRVNAGETTLAMPAEAGS